MIPAFAVLGGSRMTFGAKLRELRAVADLTQEQLAERSGQTLKTVRNHEQELRGPSWEAVVAYARALGKTADVFSDCDEVVSGTTPPRRKKKRTKK